MDISPETLKALSDLGGVAIAFLIVVVVAALANQFIKNNNNTVNRNSDETQHLLKLFADNIAALKGLDVTLQAQRDGHRQNTEVMETQAVVLSSIRDTLIEQSKSSRDHGIAVTETIGTLAVNVGDLESVLRARTDEIIVLLRRIPVDITSAVREDIAAMLLNTVNATPKSITGEIKKAIIADAAPTNNTGGENNPS